MNVHSRQLKRAYDEDDLDLIEEYWAMESRQSLWAFRQYMDPQLVKGWWVANTSQQFQHFFERMENGERPKMLIEAPPQHGKSRGLQDAIGWFSGKRPNLKTIFGSYSDELGVTTNTFLQRLYDNPKYRRTFPDTRISSQLSREDGKWARNSSFLEYVGSRGSFRNVTVNGQVNGKSLDLGVVDDPIKGRKEAQSKLSRDTAWNWLMDDFFSRFSDDAGFIMMTTRWHVDDPAGRWLLKFPETIVLKYPALFVETPEAWKNDAYDPREPGEALFPEHKSKAFLMERKSSYTVSSWESLYQQMPIVAGGGTFPVAKFRKSEVMPTRDEIKKAVRYWDKAGTEGGGAFSSGTLMLWLKNGHFFIANIARGQWGALEREQTILQTAKNDAADWGRVEIWLEQEPGSGGKESAERSVAMLAGYPAHADKVTGSKEIRAEPYAAQQQAGHVILYVAPWNQEFIDEHETFPNGRFKDQVDSTAGAFAKCVTKTYKYDTSLGWVGAINAAAN